MVKLPFALQADEQVLAYCHRHWVYMWPSLIAAILIAIVPSILAIILVQNQDVEGVARVLIYVVAAAWAIFWGARAYFTWYRFQNDLWIVTNQRLIDSFKKHWFHHSLASAELIDIEDVSVSREGPLQTMFNYGSLRCQTAGAATNFTLAGIPDPAGILGTLDSARDAARREALRGEIL